jgi:hypothetical protein
MMLYLERDFSLLTLASMLCGCTLKLLFNPSLFDYIHSIMKLRVQ